MGRNYKFEWTLINMIYKAQTIKYMRELKNQNNGCIFRENPALMRDVTLTYDLIIEQEFSSV